MRRGIVIAPLILLLVSCDSMPSSSEAIVDRLNSYSASFADSHNLAGAHKWAVDPINPDLLPLGAAMVIATTNSFPYCALWGFYDADSASNWVIAEDPTEAGGGLSLARDSDSGLVFIILTNKRGSYCETVAKEFFLLE